jgi:hypothetical protein
MPTDFSTTGSHDIQNLPVREQPNSGRGRFSPINHGSFRPAGSTPNRPSSLRNVSTPAGNAALRSTQDQSETAMRNNVELPPSSGSSLPHSISQPILSQRSLSVSVVSNNDKSRGPGTGMLDSTTPRNSARQSSMLGLARSYDGYYTEEQAEQEETDSSDPVALYSRDRPLMSAKIARVEIPVMTPKKLGRPFKSTQSAPPANSLPKKRGRPFQSAEAAAKAAAKKAASASESADGQPQKKSRPFKIPQGHVEVEGPEPHFKVFVCEWPGCPAELFNLDTLRKHLHVVHCKRQANKMVPCLWDNCHDKHGVLDEATQSKKMVETRFEFKHREDWKEHVEFHLRVLQYHLGDGPASQDLSTYCHRRDHDKNANL